MNITQQIASELTIRQEQVDATLKLLDEGATVPFIARYRKEATGGLDDTQLRNLDERLRYLRELNERRTTILKSIAEQEKLTPELEKKINATNNKTELEDLYLPYKPKRRTKAQIAREAGLQPLAQQLLEQQQANVDDLARAFINPEKEINDVQAALDGARQIIMEEVSEEPELIGRLREYLISNAVVSSAVVKNKENDAAKFRDYFEYSEAYKNIPSHRALALLRGQREGFLRVHIGLPENPTSEKMFNPGEQMIADHYQIKASSNKWLLETIRWAWKIKVMTRLELDLMMSMREAAEITAIEVFATNLKDLLLTAPAGRQVTMGLDPGLRTGVKVVVVDDTGKLLQHATIFPHAPRNKWDESIQQLAKLCQQYKVQLISIGNGTASRETDKLVHELMQKHSEFTLKKVVTSEAGASVYSASELASQEFPDLDVSFRGAVSIGRRLQDPLAELVKIEPKAIGVGQYQHDVNQTKLTRSLDNVVEDCVNAVGVDVNTASSALLQYIAGLNKTLAHNIVSYRDENGAFTDRKTILKVARMGEKSFQQAAGFLRINQGKNPLDASAVHPETYPVVDRILQKHSKTIEEIIGNSSFLKQLNPTEFADEEFGVPTVTDIISELDKPGRDPRPEFATATFADDIHDIKDLTSGMSLEGVITNVTNFGAFVDIGVHQDGLVHISQLADKFVKDPREVVKTGDIVKVTVVDVDAQRRRIALTMRTKTKTVTETKTDKPKQVNKPQRKSNQVKIGGQFADALSNALKQS